MNSKSPHSILHNRWSISIIAQIHLLGGTKFITLINHLSISRSVLTAALKKLMTHNLIIRNPGYGHPLRPEYLLTEQGCTIALFCQELVQCIEDHHASRIGQSKWALRIIFHTAKGGIRFSALKSCLSPITPRALSEELKLLQAEGYLKRRVIDDYPPATLYTVTAQSTPFVNIFEKHKPLIIDYF
ncbi:winged helix-turn-helix transcriptional regulator [candidate division CSSED10-310 bacterium]|uniref:Winged helix-turn-helix transcriptional regulator n=1 Tax=candidate division CSSED10-310 bacterium TaxID=2855610 RepID=A0ABV6YV52_UNCC1